MNLLNDPWIPVKRRSGVREMIRPCDLTSGYDDPIDDLDSPRSDFDGALVQFLIALVQTKLPPENEREWRSKFKQPPPPSSLQAAWESDTNAFCLDGDNRRFGQDLELRGSDAEILTVNHLLGEAPGKKTREENRDHFVKRDDSSALCQPCAAAALFSFQTNALQGGRGYLTGLRRDGHLTTLVLGDTLWQTVWLNTLCRPAFEARYGNTSLTEIHHQYPWMGTIRTSETHPKDVHPGQVFWSLPLRIWLHFEEASAPCSICASKVDIVIREVQRNTKGVKYWEYYPHPLSPYVKVKEGSKPLRGQPNGVGYHDWMGLVYPEPDNAAVPAATVGAYVNGRSRFRKKHLQLWAFGYEPKQFAVLSWVDARFPLFLPQDRESDSSEKNDELREQYQDLVKRLVESSVYMQHAAISCTMKAISESDKKMKDLTPLLEQRFRNLTDKDFKKAQEKLLEESRSNAEFDPILHEWLKVLKGNARQIFREFAHPESCRVKDPTRLATQWNKLNRTLHGKKLLGILGVPAPTPSPSQA